MLREGCILAKDFVISFYRRLQVAVIPEHYCPNINT